MRFAVSIAAKRVRVFARRVVAVVLAGLAFAAALPPAGTARQAADEPLFVPWSSLLPGLAAGYDPTSENLCVRGDLRCVDAVVREMSRRSGRSRPRATTTPSSRSRTSGRPRSIDAPSPRIPTSSPTPASQAASSGSCDLRAHGTKAGSRTWEARIVRTLPMRREAVLSSCRRRLETANPTAGSAVALSRPTLAPRLRLAGMHPRARASETAPSTARSTPGRLRWRRAWSESATRWSSCVPRSPACARSRRAADPIAGGDRSACRGVLGSPEEAAPLRCAARGPAVVPGDR